jgi:cardiolipin synthase
MPLKARHLPNVISSLRMGLVPPIGWCLWKGQLELTLVLVLAAAASDLLDGFLARRFGWESRWGALLDPAGDKLLMVTLFVLLSLMHEVPLWLAATAIGRELVLVSGAIVYRLRLGPFEVKASRVSKLNTLIEALYLLAVIARAAFGEPPAVVLTALGALTFVTVVVSGIDYVLRYGHSALAAARAPLPGVRGANSS